MIDVILAVAVVVLTGVIMRLFFKLTKLQIQLTVVVKSQLETLNLIGTLFETTRERKENATRKTK